MPLAKTDGLVSGEKNSIRSDQPSVKQLVTFVRNRVNIHIQSRSPLKAHGAARSDPGYFLSHCGRWSSVRKKVYMHRDGLH